MARHGGRMLAILGGAATLGAGLDAAGLMAAPTVDGGSSAVPVPLKGRGKVHTRARPNIPDRERRPAPVVHECRQARRRREREGS